MIEFLSQPWPWWVAGPLIGLMVPAILLLTGQTFGVSSNLRDTCAAVLPRNIEYFKYNWKEKGLWLFVYVGGILIGGIIAGTVLSDPNPIAISEATKADLYELGLTDLSGYVPPELFSWSALLSLRGIFLIVIGGLLLGFGARYAGGCTSGHGITGLATFQWRSLVAIIGFFIGGIFVTHVVYPVLF